MGELKGFLKYERNEPHTEPTKQRLQHFNEFVSPFSATELTTQSSRCMDCGVAFCHRACPLGNLIPEWNSLASEGAQKAALDSLLQTNNFPEFTGRICPAPCEAACVLGINSDPVAIEHVEMTLAEIGFDKGWIHARPPSQRSGKKVAIVGSGPAGLAAAQQLNRAGHTVTIYERSPLPGGLLRYGIPNFKLEKATVDRRIALLEEEGIVFRCHTALGKNIFLPELETSFDAVLLACGVSRERDLMLPGRAHSGVCLAMDYLAGGRLAAAKDVTTTMLTAEGKDVVVIGGGDTGSDCVGTALRQKARSVVQLEILDQPLDVGHFPRRHERPKQTPWPEWPLILRTSTSHEEGGERAWNVETLAFVHNSCGQLTAVQTQEIKWTQGENGRLGRQAIPNSEIERPCQLAIIACGFAGSDLGLHFAESGLLLDDSGKPKTSQHSFQTNREKIFVAGDIRRGASLVVWAIDEGRRAAAQVDSFLSRPCQE